MVKAVADVGYHLGIDHLVGCLCGKDARPALMSFKSFLGFTLGFAGAKNKNRASIANRRNDLVIVPRQVSGIFALPGIVRRPECLSSALTIYT